MPEQRESVPVFAQFSAHHLIIGCGVAIFHVASARVVVCHHTRDGYWFLPKGRRDAGEMSERAAEREGFEESGYRNRLLPLPVKHRQPRPHGSNEFNLPSRYVTEPVWTQFLPLTARTQYLLFWYIAETLPPLLEESANTTASSPSTNSPSQAPYQPPPCYPPDLRLLDRVRTEPKDYEPPRHEGTGVNEEEMLYRSYLLKLDDAVTKLRGSVMADVVKEGWEAIQTRMREEEWLSQESNAGQKQE